jgi:hypothetical protein
VILSPFAVFLRWQEVFMYLAAIGRQEAHSRLPYGPKTDRYDDRGLKLFDTTYGELDALRRLLPEPLDRFCFVSAHEIRRACEAQAVEEWEADRVADWRLGRTLAGEMT